MKYTKKATAKSTVTFTMKLDAKEWAEVILCTGSTVCNGTIVDYLDTGKQTYFFGTSLAGVAALLGLQRLCCADEYNK